MAQGARATKVAKVDRREGLLALARQIIADEGLQALTMSRLAERAKVSKPIVYNHFDDREAVAVALLEDHFGAIKDFFGGRVSRAQSLTEYVQAVVEAAFAFDSVSATPIRKITNGFSAGDAVNRVYLQAEAEFRDRWASVLVGLHVAPATARVVSTVLSAMVSSAVYGFGEGDEISLAKQTLTLLIISALHAVAPDRVSATSPLKP